MDRTRLLALCWAIVAVSLCAGDHFFHVRTGVLSYHWHPFVDGQSLWVWLVFAVASAVFVASAVVVPIKDVPETVPWPAMLDGIVLFLGAYALSGQLGTSHPALLFWALVLAWLVRIGARYRDLRAYVLHGIGLAVLGVLAESLFSALGLFDYQLRQIVGCPWWLAGLYLHGSIALLESARGAAALSPASATR